MPSKSQLSLLLAFASGVVSVELFRWAHRAASLNRLFDSVPDFTQMVLYSPWEFAWVRYSWFLVALIFIGFPLAVRKRSVTAILVVQLLGFVFAFLHVLWDVGTPPKKFDLRLLHPVSLGVLLAQVCAAGTLASLVLAALHRGEGEKKVNSVNL